jgi:hypothetical protein
MRHRRSALLGGTSASAVAAVLATVLAGTAWAAGPAPVSDLTLTTRDARVIAHWTPSPETPESTVCWALNTPPSSPDSVGATCSDVLSSSRYGFDAVDGQQYGVSVFSFDSATSAYGSAVSDTITAEDAPPVPVQDLRSEASMYGGNSVELFWSDPANADTQSYLVSVGEGLDTPDYNPLSDRETTQRRDNAYGLEPGQVYTVAVRVKDHGDHVGPPAVLHLTGRSPGLSAVDDRRDGLDRDDIDARLPSVAVSGQDDGHLRAAYVQSRHVWYTSRIRSAAWGKPVSISGDTPHSGLRDVVVASTPTGDVAVAWSAGQGVALAVRRHGHWSHRHATRHSNDRAAGVTIDGRGNVHVLVRRTTSSGGGLLLLTRQRHGFTNSRFPDSGRYDAGLLTLDRETRDVVVVDQHDGAKRSIVRLAVLRPGASSIRGVRTLLDRSRGATSELPTSVAAADGRVIVAVERRSSSGDTGRDGLFTVTATAKGVGAPTRVPHTTEADTAAVVWAADSGRVVVSWRRTDPAWSPDVVGVWSEELVREAGAWAAATPRRWSSSAYAFPTGTFRDERGHVYATFVTVYDDVTEGGDATGSRPA